MERHASRGPPTVVGPRAGAPGRRRRAGGMRTWTRPTPGPGGSSGAGSPAERRGPPSASPPLRRHRVRRRLPEASRLRGTDRVPVRPGSPALHLPHRLRQHHPRRPVGLGGLPGNQAPADSGGPNRGSRRGADRARASPGTGAGEARAPPSPGGPGRPARPRPAAAGPSPRRAGQPGRSGPWRVWGRTPAASCSPPAPARGRRGREAACRTPQGGHPGGTGKGTL